MKTKPEDRDQTGAFDGEPAKPSGTESSIAAWTTDSRTGAMSEAGINATSQFHPPQSRSPEGG